MNYQLDDLKLIRNFTAIAHMILVNYCWEIYHWFDTSFILHVVCNIGHRIIARSQSEYSAVYYLHTAKVLNSSLSGKSYFNNFWKRSIDAKTNWIRTIGNLMDNFCFVRSLILRSRLRIPLIFYVFASKGLINFLCVRPLFFSLFKLFIRSYTKVPYWEMFCKVSQINWTNSKA